MYTTLIPPVNNLDYMPVSSLPSTLECTNLYVLVLFF